MKTTGLILFAALFSLNGILQGQDLFLTFSGSGASASVDSVKVENLTRGEKLIIGGSQILHLEQIVTEIGKLTTDVKGGITFSPNPMNEYSIMEFSIPRPGKTIISIIDLGGKEILKLNGNLSRGHHSYRVSGIKRGIHFVRVSSGQYSLTGTLVSTSSQGNARAEYINTISVKEPEKDIKALKKDEPVKKSDLSEITMQFRYGDCLKFTAASGKYRTIIIDIIVDITAGDKTITFDFIPCTDADNNNYPVVKIGEYTWMAENLKTTKYKDGTPVPYQTFNSNTPDSLIFSWEGYSWYNNDPGYKDTYGALYKMDTFKSGKLCPAGWHAPNNAEWGYLTDFLGGSSEAGGRLKETGTAHWAAPNTGATNESGFTALPGGRLDHYTFLGLGTFATFWSTSKCGGSSDCGWSVSFSEKSIFWTDIYEEVGYSVRCVYGEEPMIPEVGTWPLISYITANEAYTGVIIKNDHGLPVTQKGVCWSTTPLPTIIDPHTSNGVGLITGLTPATKYYVRAYATNSAGTGYSMSISFTTKAIDAEDVKADVEGNVYEIVHIGSQVWMTENLRTTRFNDGTPIGLITDDNLAWWNSVTPAYCFHPRGELMWHGAIYNWQSVNSGKLCPAGWHVPADTDWTELTNYLISNGYNYDGTYEGNKIAKALAAWPHYGWKSSVFPGTPGNTDYPEKINASGFSARPAGTRGWEFSPQINEVAVFWSSTPSHLTGNYFILSYSGVSGILTGPDSGDIQTGWAVRCLKDE